MKVSSIMLSTLIGVVVFAASCFAQIPDKDLLEFSILSGDIVIAANPKTTIEGTQFRRGGFFLGLIFSDSGRMIRDSSWVQELRSGKTVSFFQARSILTIDPSSPNLFSLEICPKSSRFNLSHDGLYFIVALMKLGRRNAQIVCSSVYQFEVAESKIIDSSLRKTKTLPQNVLSNFEVELKTVAKEEFLPYERIKESLRTVLEDL